MANVSVGQVTFYKMPQIIAITFEKVVGVTWKAKLGNKGRKTWAKQIADTPSVRIDAVGETVAALCSLSTVWSE